MVATYSPAVAMAQTALKSMTEAQQLALCIQVAVRVADPSCALQMTRLASAARDSATDLMRAGFERECG